MLCALREAPGGQRLLLSTLHEEYEFVSPSSVAIAELVALFLGGLKERSVFAMALQDRKATGAHWERDGVATHGKGGFLISTRPKAGLRDASIHILGSARSPSEGGKRRHLTHISQGHQCFQLLARLTHPWRNLHITPQPSHYPILQTSDQRLREGMHHAATLKALTPTRAGLEAIERQAPDLGHRH